MKIVLDSNIIIANFRMTGSSFRVLKDWLPRTDHALHVPQVVVDEVINKFSEMLNREDNKIRSSLVKLNQLTGSDLRSPLEDVKAKETEYGEFLRGQLRALKASITPYPETAHATLVSKDLSRQRPFSDSGAGYRDALIWESVLNIAGEDDTPIAFITADGDFADDDGGLHPDLLRDLEARDLNRDRVVLFDKMERFIDEYFKPTMERLTDLEAQLKEGTYPAFNLADEMALRIQDEYATVEWDPGQTGFPEEFETVTIDMVGPVHTIQVDEVRHLGETEILVDLVMNADVEFDFFITHSNLAILDADETPFISDYNWNEWVVAASQAKTVRVYVTLIIDTGEDKISSVTIHDLYPPEWDGP